MAGSRTLKLSILADIDDLKKNLTAGSKDVETFGDKISDFGKKAGLALAAAGAAAAAFAVKFGKDAIMAASDLNETISKTQVLFGDASKSVIKFAENAAARFGQSKQQALDAAATFATFGKAAGLAGDDLVKFSTDFVALASDLASFNNTSPEDAILAIGSALRGEAEPLRRYGVLLDDATMRQTALELGIISTTKQALTPQQKVLAAQELIFRQTGAAQGDFARTSDGLANSQRILTAQIENVTAQIGTAFLPIMNEVMKFIGTRVVPIIQKLADGFSGRDPNSLTNSLMNVANIIKNILMPVWDGLVYGFNVIKRAIEDNKEGFSSFAKIIQDYVAPVLGVVLGGALKVLGEIAGGVLVIVGKVAGFIADVVETAIKGVNALIRAYNSIPLLPNISQIPTGSVPQVTVPRINTGGSSSAASLSLPTITAPTSASGGGGAGTAASSAAAASGSAMANLVPTVTLGGAPAGYRPETFTPTVTLGGAPAGYITNNINIGVAGDPEGVARTVVDVINQSYYRGGLGAQAYKL